MATFIYRFRPTDALLEGFQELEKQEIYFASPKELNDPLEGFKDVFWRGDEILWSNLVRHYLLCLMHAVIVAMLCEPDRAFDQDWDLVFRAGAPSPSPAQRSLHRRICEIFFCEQDATRIPALLAVRNSPIRRSELIVHLTALRFRALNAVLTGMEEWNLMPSRPADDPIRIASARALLCRVEALNQLEQRHPDRPDISELTCARDKLVVDQQNLIFDYNGIPPNGPALRAVVAEFPSRYVGQLDQLLYNDWYTVSFVDCATNDAVIWGTYGDGHNGVCLKFRAHSNTGGKPFINLRRITGWRSDKNGSAPIYGDVAHEFSTVEYAEKFVEIDFFRSLGRVNMPVLQSWYRDPDGNASPFVADILAGSEAWRQRYWEGFERAITTKLEDWSREGEL